MVCLGRQVVIHDKIILSACFDSSVENICIQSNQFSKHMCEPNLSNIYHIEIIFQQIHMLV